MKELLANGRVIDLALVVIGVELLVLLIVRRRQEARGSVPTAGGASAARAARGLRPLDLVGQLLAGAFLLLAVRLILAGADYRWTLLALTASFPAHLFDVVRRMKQAA